MREKLAQPKLKTEVQKRDLFYTPKYAVDLLIPFIPKNITKIWECASGAGHITKVLESSGYTVFETDLQQGFNFLFDKPDTIIDKNTAIITNPPFSLKREFFKKCLEYDVPFALLIPGDYCLWTIDAIRYHNCKKLIPSRRINFYTPRGTSCLEGSSLIHSLWLTKDFLLETSETFVELTLEERKANV